MKSYLFKIFQSRLIFEVIPLLLGILLLFFSGCAPFPSAEVTVDLSQAIALSKSKNISQVAIDTESGRMLMVASVSSGSINVVDFNGVSRQITNGTRLDTNIDSLNLAQLT